MIPATTTRALFIVPQMELKNMTDKEAIALLDGARIQWMYDSGDIMIADSGGEFITLPHTRAALEKWIDVNLVKSPPEQDEDVVL